MLINSNSATIGLNSNIKMIVRFYSFQSKKDIKVLEKLDMNVISPNFMKQSGELLNNKFLRFNNNKSSINKKIDKSNTKFSRFNNTGRNSSNEHLLNSNVKMSIINSEVFEKIPNVTNNDSSFDIKHETSETLLEYEARVSSTSVLVENEKKSLDFLLPTSMIKDRKVKNISNNVKLVDNRIVSTSKKSVESNSNNLLEQDLDLFNLLSTSKASSISTKFEKPVLNTKI